MTAIWVYVLVGCFFAVVALIGLKSRGCSGFLACVGAALAVVLWPYFLVIAIFDG